MARKVRRKSGIYLTLAMGIGMLLPSAFSMWNIGSFGFTFSGEKTDVKGVAVVSNNPNVLYTTIERAVEVANGSASANNPLTVYVLPGISNAQSPIVISDNVTLNAGVTLELPYEMTIADGTITALSSTAYQNGSAFADGSATDVKKNEKTEVYLSDGKTLTVNSGASLIVGGILGAAGGGQLNGQTSGSYAQISLGENSKIRNFGNMEVRGYIKAWDESFDDTCSVEIGSSDTSGAQLKLPLVVYDFLGGTDALSGSCEVSTDDLSQIISSFIDVVANWDGALWDGIFPMETYDFPNISVPFSAYSGNSVRGLYDLLVSGNHASGEVGLAGSSDSFLLFDGGSTYATFDYDSAVGYDAGNGRIQGLTYNDQSSLRASNSTKPAGSVLINDGQYASLTRAHLHGNFRTGDISVSVKLLNTDAINQTVNTAGGWIGLTSLLSKHYPALAFPFSYKWQITASGGTFSFPNQVKFLPGSLVKVESNASVVVKSGGKLVFLDGVTTPTTERYPSTFTDSTFINNGSLVVESGGSFGGIIHTLPEGSFEGDSATSSISFNGTSIDDYHVTVKSFNWKNVLSDGSYSYYGNDFDARAYVRYSDTGKPREDPQSLFGWPEKSFVGKFDDTGTIAEGSYLVTPSDITEVKISSADGKFTTDKDQAKDFILTAVVSPAGHMSTITGYKWELAKKSSWIIAGSGNIVGNTDQATCTVHLDKATAVFSDCEWTVTVTVTFTKADGSSGSVSGTCTLVTKT